MPLCEPFDVIYKTLLHNKVIYPLDNSHPYDPQPWPPWWSKITFFEYHQNKGHKTRNSIKLHHKVQELIDDGDIIVDGHNMNLDHKDFEEPFLYYEKGETQNKNLITRSTIHTLKMMM